MPARKKVKIPTVIDVQIPLYHQVITAASDAESLVEYVKTEFDNPEVTNFVEEFTTCNAGGFFQLEYDGQMIFLMYAPELAIVCHESIHAAWSILDMVGVKVKAKNHEALAYLAGHIFKECHDRLEYK